MFGQLAMPFASDGEEETLTQRANLTSTMAFLSSLCAAAAAVAASQHVTAVSLLVVAVALGMQPTGTGIVTAAAAGLDFAGSPCSMRERLICDQDRTTHRRCECSPTCHYFGSCCHSELEAATADLAAPAAVNNSADAGRGTGSCSKRRLQRGLYKCEPERYGDWPTYVVDRCPPASGKPRQLAQLCDQDLRERNYFDARFWPVTSNVTSLVYQSVYCALCHGESARNITRWTASLNCRNDTDLINRTQLLRRCKVLFAPPASFNPPRCWKNFVDTCELPIDQRVSAAIVAAGCGAAASIRGDASPGPVGPAAQTFDTSAVDVASAGSLTVAGADAAVACYQAPQAVVWWGTTPFRNSHCAECSGLNMLQLVCSEVKYNHLVEYPGISFRALLDSGGGGRGGVVGSGGGTQMQCRGDEYYDHWLGTCASLCPTGTILTADGSNCGDTLQPSTNESVAPSTNPTVAPSTTPTVAPSTTPRDLYASSSPSAADSNRTQTFWRPLSLSLSLCLSLLLCRFRSLSLF